MPAWQVLLLHPSQVDQVLLMPALVWQLLLLHLLSAGSASAAAVSASPPSLPGGDDDPAGPLSPHPPDIFFTPMPACFGFWTCFCQRALMAVLPRSCPPLASLCLSMVSSVPPSHGQSLAQTKSGQSNHGNQDLLQVPEGPRIQVVTLIELNSDTEKKVQGFKRPSGWSRQRPAFRKPVFALRL